MRFESPTGAANANLKASSRAQPAGVRHPLTSQPFFISALTCSVFFLQRVLPGAIDSSQTGFFNEQSLNGRSAAPLNTSLQNPHHPVYKNPSTLLTQVPRLPNCFSSSCLYSMNLMPMCDRARASSPFRRSSIKPQESKTPSSPPKF